MHRRMRYSLVVKASDCQCTSCNGPGFDPSIRRHSGIWGAADEAVLNTVRKKIPPPKKKLVIIPSMWQSTHPNCHYEQLIINNWHSLGLHLYLDIVVHTEHIVVFTGNLVVLKRWRRLAFGAEKFEFSLLLVVFPISLLIVPVLHIVVLVLPSRSVFLSTTVAIPGGFLADF